MRYYVGELLNGVVGTQKTVEINLGFQDLADDLAIEYVRGTLFLFSVGENDSPDKAIAVNGTLHIGVEGECVRCLEPIQKDIDVVIEEVFRPNTDVFSEDPVLTDRVAMITVDGFIDIKPILRELVIVSTPMHMICTTACKGLCPICGNNLNQDPCECAQDDIDPRLVALKSLLMG